MKIRNTRLVLLAAGVILSSVFLACSVTVAPNDNGITGTIQIANKTYTFSLDSTGEFSFAEAGQTVRNAAKVKPLFTDPEDTPASGVIALSTDDIDVIPLTAQKTQAASQVVAGTAELNVYIGPSSSTSPCSDGTYVGMFTITYSDEAVSINTTGLDLPTNALEEVRTGVFTICLEMTASSSVQIAIAGMDIEFGPARDDNTDTNTNDNTIDNDNDNTNTDACSSDDDCVSGEVCSGGTCIEDTTPGVCTIDADCDGDARCVDGACVEEDQYAFSVTVSGQGGVSPASGAYDQSEQIEVTATPEAGWRFDRWTGDLTGRDNPTTLTISEDKSVTAVFVQEVESAITFAAVYDRLWDTDAQFDGYYFDEAVTSGDGNRMMWLVHDTPDYNRYAVMMDFDGSDQTMISVPASDVAEGYEAFGEAAIDEDGSRAFFTRGNRYIFKVEGGIVTQILDRSTYSLSSVDLIQTTDDGEWVYFLNDASNNNDVYRVSQAGGAPELVINDVEAVLENGQSSAQVADFSISGDGSKIAMTMQGRWSDSTYVSGGELFAFDNGVFTQLTSDRADYDKFNPRISGDGSKIVFGRGSTSWHSINSDGTGEVHLGAKGNNIGGPLLTEDGSIMFYSDSSSGGGVLLNTDGSGQLNLFPAWNITNIAISPTYYHQISDDGTRISFYTQYSILPENAAFYVGYIDEVSAATPSVADAPIVASIHTAPSSMPRGDDDAVVMFSIDVSDTDGLDDITNTAADGMVDGVHENESATPARSYADPYDDGEGLDPVADDGDYALVFYPAALIDTLSAMTVRISFMDARKTVTVVDTELTVSGS